MQNAEVINWIFQFRISLRQQLHCLKALKSARRKFLCLRIWVSYSNESSLICSLTRQTCGKMIVDEDQGATKIHKLKLQHLNLPAVEFDTYMIFSNFGSSNEVNIFTTLSSPLKLDFFGQICIFSLLLCICIYQYSLV